MSPDVAKTVIEYLESFDDVDLKIKAINELKSLIHQHSPFCREPVDCVLWVEAKTVEANDYNPNVMATVEKTAGTLYRTGWFYPTGSGGSPAATALVVDGFHRHLIGKSRPELNRRLHGYLPVTLINAEREGQKERIAATIRHNRARANIRSRRCPISSAIYIARAGTIGASAKSSVWMQTRCCA